MKQGIHTNKKENCLVQHIVEKRFGKMVTTGTLVGHCINGKILIGWSRVNVGAKDKFDAQLAKLYASHNLLMGNPVPESMQAEYDRFVERCIRFFKDKKMGQISFISPANYHQNWVKWVEPIRLANIKKAQEKKQLAAAGNIILDNYKVDSVGFLTNAK